MIKVAIYLINWIPTRTLEWKTPLESLQQALRIPNLKPNLCYIKVYSSHIYVKMNLIPRQDKVASQVHISYLVGYKSTIIYHIWISGEDLVERVRNITFDEILQYDLNKLVVDLEL